MHKITVDIDVIPWNEDELRFEKQHVTAGTAFGHSAAHVDLGWLGEVQFSGSDPVKIEALAEALFTAARDLRIAQVNAQEQAVDLDERGAA